MPLRMHGPNNYFTCSDTSSVKMTSPPAAYADSWVTLGFSFASRKRACCIWS